MGKYLNRHFTKDTLIGTRKNTYQRNANENHNVTPIAY